MSEKYVDVSSVVNVIGNIYKNPSLLTKEDKYIFIEDDFPSDFHKIVFGSIYNIWQLGAKQITLEAIHDYLEQRPKKLAEYKVNKGDEYILKCAEAASDLTFDYYYNRLKKMSLLRAYANENIDVSFIYDESNIFDTKKKQQQEDWLDNASLLDIVNKVNEKTDAIKIKFADGTLDEGCNLGDNALELVNSYLEAPAFGYPLYGKFIGTVTRGARLGKFFLRSAATGVGKTRSMIADACYIGCTQMYDTIDQKWILLGAPQSTLFIATEQDLSEVQSMALAFIAGVDEEHILTGNYFAGEYDRVVKATQILAQGKIKFECLPDFTMKLIENVIKKHIREDDVEYVFFDYIHSSASILMEIGGNSGVKGLREDNVLFLMASKLKDIAVKYGVFILSSTQLNSDYQVSETPDQNLLRGAKSIADRIDYGSILMAVTKEDKEKLQPFVNKNGITMPNVKMSIYKNRQGRWKDMYLWMYADRSMCRFDALFATSWTYEPIEMEDIKIHVEEASAF